MSTDNYLPPSFYEYQSSSSLSTLHRWATTRGITTEDGYLSSYQQIERIALSLGLAFRALWIAQFPDNYHHVPIYVLNSPYPFVEYDQLGHLIENLIEGYSDVCVPPLPLPPLIFITKVECSIDSIRLTSDTAPKRRMTDKQLPATDMSGDGSQTLANASKQSNNVGSSDVVDKPSLTLDKGPEVSQPPLKSIGQSDDVSQNSGRDGTKGIWYVPSPTVFKLILIVFSRTLGLSGVPTHLQYL